MRQGIKQVSLIGIVFLISLFFGQAALAQHSCTKDGDCSPGICQNSVCIANPNPGQTVASPSNQPASTWKGQDVFCYNDSIKAAACVWASTEADADKNNINTKNKTNYTTCERTQDNCAALLAAKKQAYTEGSLSGTEAGGLIAQAIPSCVLNDPFSGYCRDVSVFVVFLINIAQGLLGIVGALALGAFVYGGFLLIISQGETEKVKKGTSALTAALIGLVIAFGGYMLVSFLGTALGLSETFLLK